MKNKLLIYPHSLLRKKSLRVKNFGAELQATLKIMRDILAQHQGLGLAANQIGLAQRIILIRPTPQYPDAQPVAVINPKLISHSTPTFLQKEGCLSVPGKQVEIKRFTKITLIGQNEAGRRIKIKAKDVLARAFQHELDHLNGILIIDYETPLEKSQPVMGSDPLYRLEDV